MEELVKGFRRFISALDFENIAVRSTSIHHFDPFSEYEVVVIFWEEASPQACRIRSPRINKELTFDELGELLNPRLTILRRILQRAQESTDRRIPWIQFGQITVIEKELRMIVEIHEEGIRWKEQRLLSG